MRLVCTVITTLLLAGCTTLFSSPHLQDSHQATDTLKVLELSNLAASLRDTDTRSALMHAKKAKALADSLGHARSITLAEETLGNIYYRLGDYSLAFEYSDKALKAYRKFNDAGGISRTLISIGTIYFEKKQYDKGVDYFKEGSNIAFRLGDLTTHIRGLNNISLAYYRISKLDSAEHYALKSIEFSKQNNLSIGFPTRTLADVAIDKGEIKKAKKLLYRIIGIADSTKNNFLKATSLNRLANCFKKENKPDSTIWALKINEIITATYGMKDERERVYLSIADAYRSKNDIQQAFDYQSKYIQLHDSLRDAETNQRIAYMQTRFDSETKETQIQLLSQQALLKEQQLRNQKTLNYFFFGCMLLLVIFMLIVIYAYRRIRAANTLLTEKNKQIEIQTGKLNELNKTKDKIFSILGHDLRGPVASLTAVFTMLTAGNITAGEFQMLSKSLKYDLDNLNYLLTNLLHWSKTQFTGINVTITSFPINSLVKEIIDLLRPQSERKKVIIEVSASDDPDVRADRNHMLIILRNLISNAIKFSHSGKTVTITIEATISNVLVKIVDTGIGMSQDEVEKLRQQKSYFSKVGTNNETGTGIGLKLVFELIKHSHCTLHIDSKPEKGSVFTVSIPKL
jgi:two-component system, sensor histidine kinase and response regulator